MKNGPNRALKTSPDFGFFQGRELEWRVYVLGYKL